MATIKNATNIDGKSAVYDFVGNSEETKPSGANIGENSTFTELDTGNQFYRKGNTWATMKAPGGSSSGGSLPANFPTEGAANANKFLGFDANGDYTAKEGGSGGQFVVTLTATEEEGETTYSADKTIAEIVAAHDAGKTVILRYGLTVEGMPVNIDMQCDYAQTLEPAPGVSVSAVKFSGSGIEKQGKAPTYYVTGMNDGQGDDSFGVTEQIYATDSDIPSPLIVNLTLDTSSVNPVLRGDKTFDNILTVKSNGNHVMLKLDNTEGSGTLMCMDVINASFDDADSKYHVMFCLGDDLAEAESASGGNNFSYEMT